MVGVSQTGDIVITIVMSVTIMTKSADSGEAGSARR